MEQHHVVSHSHSGRRCAVLFLLLLLLDQRTAYGQSEAGSATLTGTVFDASGAVVSAARVTVTHRDAGWSRETVTNDAGLYTVARLPPGPYVIVAGRDGFQTVRREGVELLVGSRTVVDAVLQPGTIEQTLTVSAAAPVIDAGRTHAGSVVNERAVRNLPINGRNFLDFTLLAPHVIRDPRVGDLAISGQRGPANSLLVDGVDANSAFWGQSVGRASFRNPYSFSMDAV